MTDAFDVPAPVTMTVASIDSDPIAKTSDDMAILVLFVMCDHLWIGDDIKKVAQLCKEAFAKAAPLVSLLMTFTHVDVAMYAPLTLMLDFRVLPPVHVTKSDFSNLPHIISPEDPRDLMTTSITKCGDDDASRVTVIRASSIPTSVTSLIVMGWVAFRGRLHDGLLALDLFGARVDSLEDVLPETLVSLRLSTKYEGTLNVLPTTLRCFDAGAKVGLRTSGSHIRWRMQYHWLSTPLKDSPMMPPPLPEWVAPAIFQLPTPSTESLPPRSFVSGSFTAHPSKLEGLPITPLSMLPSHMPALLAPLTLPPLLTRLHFGETFDQPVDLSRVVVLLILSFGAKFNQPVDGRLPPRLVEVSFAEGFNKPLDALPDTLIVLDIRWVQIALRLAVAPLAGNTRNPFYRAPVRLRSPQSAASRDSRIDAARQIPARFAGPSPRFEKLGCYHGFGTGYLHRYSS